MDRDTNERWREALEKIGQDTVRHKLDLRPGPPTELWYDIVDEPPYPDRAFCEAWCRGTPVKAGGMSGTGVMVLIMSILVAVCGLRAFTSSSPDDANWLSPGTGQYHSPAAASPPSGSLQNAASADAGTAISNQSTQNSSVISTQDQNSLLPSCTAVTSAGNLATVQSQLPCSKLGQPFVKKSSGSGG